MQKRFIAVSTAVVALTLVFSFSARSARADSLHSQDLKLDSFAQLANSCDLRCALDSFFAADKEDFVALFSDQHGTDAQVVWGDQGNDRGNVPRGAFGFPIASHFDHRQGNGNPRSSTVPEPNSLLLAGLGLTALFLYRKNRRSNSPFPPATV